MKISSLIKEYLAPVLYLAAILGFILLLINRDLPKVGHDYGFFLPRMLDTHLHYKVNGPVIQWYTANFGAGTPAYPNPQYLQYSLPQLYMFAVNPWLALMLTVVTYSAIGFAGFYAFLRDEMGWISAACALGASFIIANGFYVEHAIVGHVGFQPFPLLGMLLFLAFTKRLGYLPAGLLMGLVIALIVNQAGFVVLIISGISLLLLFPLIYLIQPELFKPKLFMTLFVGALSAVLLCLSKVSAVLAFMRFFPRVISDQYNQTYLQGITGMVRQLTGLNFLIPYSLFTGSDVQQAISAFYHKGAGAQFGLWEMDMALSPALLLLLVVGLGYSITVLSRNRPGISAKKAVAILILCAGSWLA
ncbi:MAG: hypothetical protein ACM3PS_04160, partial [Syntrophothermus sp.]